MLDKTKGTPSTRLNSHVAVSQEDADYKNNPILQTTNYHYIEPKTAKASSPVQRPLVSLLLQHKKLSLASLGAVGLSACGGSGDNNSVNTTSSATSDSSDTKSQSASSENNASTPPNSSSTNTTTGTSSSDANPTTNPSSTDTTNATDTSQSNTGSNTNTDNDTNTNSPKPTKTQAARFLHQTQFHADMASISDVQSIGYDAWLQREFSKPIAETGWDWLKRQGFNKAEYQFTASPLSFLLWQQTIEADDRLRKRVALALSEIVVASTSKAPRMKAFGVAAFWDILNKHAFGNYRDILYEVSTNLSMGVMLSILRSKKFNPKTKQSPDENYARELLQLFSIGLIELNLDGSPKLQNGKEIETYDNDDITNLAKVFTGYKVDDTVDNSVENPVFTKTPMRCNEYHHSKTEKRFLGLSIPANTDSKTSLTMAIDHIMTHANVAPFISKKLIQLLITSNPSPAYIRRVATVFNDNGKGTKGDLKAVITAIIMDTEARKDPQLKNTDQGKLREPMISLIQWLCTFNGKSKSGKWTAAYTQSTSWGFGQSPLMSPSVFNFFSSSYTPPNSQLEQQGKVAPEFQLVDETLVALYTNYMIRTINRGGHRTIETSSSSEIDIDFSEPLTLVNDPTALVDYLDLLLTANQLSDATKTLMIETLTAMTSTGDSWQLNKVKAAMIMVMVCAEYRVQK